MSIPSVRVLGAYNYHAVVVRNLFVDGPAPFVGIEVWPVALLVGDAKRLKHFSYANNNQSSDYDRDYFLSEELMKQTRALCGRLPWPPVDQINASINTFAIFGWGGVSGHVGWTFADVELVVRNAITRRSAPSAPMNSSWTKVAAFASGRNGQVIWDSRVAVSIVWRLDTLLNSAGIMKTTLFPNIGFAATRKTSATASLRPPYSLKWPPMYGDWDGQYAATDLVKKLVKILNDPANKYPRMPIPDGLGGYIDRGWDVWGVGQVLFMDGY